MKSSIKKSTYKAIYRLLDRVDVVNYDCGLLCGAACCNCEGDSSNPEADDYEMGIYLLPGEEKLFTKQEDWLKWQTEYAEDYDFPDSWFGKIYFVRCNNPSDCHRKMRPLQCRFFPLAPHITEDNELMLILSTLEVPYTCPLIEENAKGELCRHELRLNDDFIQATYTVWKHLIRDPLIYDLVIMDSDDRIAQDTELRIMKRGYYVEEF